MQNKEAEAKNNTFFFFSLKYEAPVWLFSDMQVSEVLHWHNRRTLFNQLLFKDCSFRLNSALEIRLNHRYIAQCCCAKA